MLTDGQRTDERQSDWYNIGSPKSFGSGGQIIGVHVACKNEEDPIKSEGTGILLHFSHYKSMGNFQYAQG